MKLNALSLTDFRSYEYADIRPSPGLNLITGSNAAGKTSILEAVNALSGQNSFRAMSDSELIRTGCEGYALCAEFESEKRTMRAEVKSTEKGRRYILNGVPKRRCDYIGSFRCVVFCPDDLKLAKGAASERRSFIDSALSQLRPNYAALSAEYNRLLKHKTAILKNPSFSFYDTLDDFSSRLCYVGARIIVYRLGFISRLNAFSGEEYAKLSKNGERFGVKYTSAVELAATANDIYNALWNAYTAHRDREIRSGSVLTGPHRDDMELTVDGLSARSRASQGQARCAALALKFALLSIIRRETGENPVLLLDDVLSELDANRRESILSEQSVTQVFVTSCETSLGASKIFVCRKSGGISGVS